MGAPAAEVAIAPVLLATVVCGEVALRLHAAGRFLPSLERLGQPLPRHRYSYLSIN